MASVHSHKPLNFFFLSFPLPRPHDLSLPCLGRASWNAAAVVCAVRWAGRLGRTGEVLARRGMSRKGMMGRGWEWCAREHAEGSSVPGVNSGHDGKCFCRMRVTGLGSKKTCREFSLTCR